MCRLTHSNWYLITLIIFVKEYELWIFPLCHFLQPPLTSPSLIQMGSSYAHVCSTPVSLHCLWSQLNEYSQINKAKGMPENITKTIKYVEVTLFTVRWFRLISFWLRPARPLTFQFKAYGSHHLWLNSMRFFPSSPNPRTCRVHQNPIRRRTALELTYRSTFRFMT
jgi:hypothetical protein